MFDKSQHIFEIGDIKVGGQPGQLPTVLIGSIFYTGHRIVHDPRKGLFDKNKAEELLEKEEELSLRTGNPRIIDVNGEYPEAMLRYIDFIAEATNSPFLIDSPNPKVGLAALKHVTEIGLVERAVYNSINPHTKPEELLAIREAGVKSAVLLTFNAKMPTVSGRLEVLTKCGGTKGLLETSRDAGVENPLIDVSVLDIPDPGPVSKAIYLVKEGFGLPSGAGLHNALGRWRRRRRLDETTCLIASAVIHAIPIALGADFLLYGPIINAPKVYTACALADAYTAYAMRQQYRIRPLTKNHPLFRIF
jgi:tetrahydromethanopterin S-methyltransferase subunit H